jgi:DNA sulfur modification protein DndD
MLLKSLKMHNFRQYKGDQNISFSCDKDKNVTVILGDNTFGKTTLLQAFNWCFYKYVLLPNAEFLLNYDVEAAMQENDSVEVSVEIELIHSNTEYVLTRFQEYVKKNGIVRPLQAQMKVSYKEIDGQTENIKESKIDNVINEILPKDLSSYFFFDTERVGSVSDRKDLAESVKGLLGLSVLDNAIKHIGTKTNKKTVLGQFYGSMDLDGDQRATEALNRIQDAQARREAIAAQIETNLSEANQYDSRKEQLDSILRDNQTTSAMQKKKEDLERKVSQELSAQTGITKALLNEYSAGSMHFFSQPLLKRASDFLHKVKVDDKGIKDLTKVTLEDIVKRGICICGCELTDGSEALKHIREEMQYVPPESIGNTVRNYKNRINNFGSSSERTFQSIKSRYEELYRSKNRVQEWNDEIEDISDRIKGKENMARYESELLDVKKRLRDLNAKKERLIRDDEASKTEIDRFQKIYDGLIAVSGKNKSTMQYIRYAEEISDWLVSTYKEKEGYIREELEEKVNGIFERMYHGHRRVAIDSKYQVTLLTTISDKEIESGESEGLNRVKNFAFIAGLVSLAKEKIVSKAGSQEFDLSSEPYPLVMDAPFSNADETHTSNISKVLPEVAEQVIMFVMQKDWRYAEPVMSNRVGSQYCLEKHSEQYSELKKGV